MSTMSLTSSATFPVSNPYFAQQRQVGLNAPTRSVQFGVLVEPPTTTKGDTVDFSLQSGTPGYDLEGAIETIKGVADLPDDLQQKLKDEYLLFFSESQSSEAWQAHFDDMKNQIIKMFSVTTKGSEAMKALNRFSRVIFAIEPWMITGTAQQQETIKEAVFSALRDEL